MALIEDVYTPNIVRQVIPYAVDHTVALAERGQILNMNKATAINLTLPSDSTAAIPIGSEVQAFQGGAGQLTFVQGSGATLLSETGTFTASTQNSLVTAKKVAANTWLLSGSGLSVLSNVIARDATELSVSNDLTKRTVFSYSVAGNKLGLDKTIQTILGGDLQFNSGITNCTLTVTVDFGGTTMYAEVTVALTTNAGRHPFYITLNLSEHGGVTNSQVVTGLILVGNAQTTTTGEGDLGNVNTAATMPFTPFYGTASVDSTTAQTFTVSFTMSQASANNGWKRENAIAFMLGEAQKGDTGAQGPAGVTGTGTGTFPTSPNSPQSGNYTLQSSDIGQRLAASSAVSQTITVPNQSTLAMSDGQMFGIHVTSTGAVTVQGGVGVTLHPTTIVSSRQDGVIWVIRMDTSNNFLVLGDFA